MGLTWNGISKSNMIRELRSPCPVWLTSHHYIAQYTVLTINQFNNIWHIFSNFYSWFVMKEPRKISIRRFHISGFGLFETGLFAQYISYLFGVHMQNTCTVFYSMEKKASCKLIQLRKRDDSVYCSSYNFFSFFGCSRRASATLFDGPTCSDLRITHAI